MFKFLWWLCDASRAATVSLLLVATCRVEVRYYLRICPDGECRADGGVYVADSHRFIADRSYVQGGRDDGDIGGAAFQAVTEGIVRLSGGNKLPPGYPGVAFQANVAEGNDSVG